MSPKAMEYSTLDGPVCGSFLPIPDTDHALSGGVSTLATSGHMRRPQPGGLSALPAVWGGVSPDDCSQDRVTRLLDRLAPGRLENSLGRLAHFEVMGVLGRGAFGVVLKAFDTPLRRYVAIKVLNPDLPPDCPSRRRFVREARTAAAVRHPHIVGIHGVGENPYPYLVMEFVPGRTLQDMLDESGPLPIHDVLRYGHQMATGLAAAHAKGVIHRDVKPANILVEHQGERRARITDFGLARAVDDTSLTQSGIILGTPLYMSPEQVRGDALDQRVDLFSLGSVLYALCSGHPPFAAPTAAAVLKRVADEPAAPLHSHRADVPDALARLISDLHQKWPADRPQTAREVADRLARCRMDLRDEARSDRRRGRDPRLLACSTRDPQWRRGDRNCAAFYRPRIATVIATHLLQFLTVAAGAALTLKVFLG